MPAVLTALTEIGTLPISAAKFGPENRAPMICAADWAAHTADGGGCLQPETVSQLSFE